MNIFKQKLSDVHASLLIKNWKIEQISVLLRQVQDHKTGVESFVNFRPHRNSK